VLRCCYLKRWQILTWARQTEVEESTLTLYTYTFNKLLAYLGDVEIEEIRVDDLRKWRAKLTATPSRRQPRLEEGKKPVGLSVYTLHRDIRQTRVFFKWCVDEEILKKNPAARLGLPKLPQGEPPKAISDEDLERMIAAALTAITERPDTSDSRPRKHRRGLKPYPTSGIMPWSVSWRSLAAG